MLELDTTVMTPSSVFETSGHVARFADWMVKDVKTGDVLRADHLVKNVLEARLAGDKEARGLAAIPLADDKKKKKKAAKATVVQLADEVVKEYEIVLAQVRFLFPRCVIRNVDLSSGATFLSSSTTTPVKTSAISAESTIYGIQTRTMRLANPSYSTSCSPAASGLLANIPGRSLSIHVLHLRR